MTTPIVKWLGGKRRIADQIIATFPSAPPGPGHGTAGWRYVEPFLGGASVYLATQAAGHRFDGAFLSDACAPLIETYRRTIHRPEFVASELESIKNWSYAAVRDKFNLGRWDGPIAAAMFLYLNRRGFNGLCRFNARGEFNVPVGDETRALHTLEELEAFRDAMRWAPGAGHLWSGQYDQAVWTTASGSAQSIFGSAIGNTIVYCDPPYVPIKAGSFVGYNAGGFDHAKFARWCHGLAERGVCVRVSNSASDVTRMLYRGFTVIEIESVRRTVGASGKSRAPVKELLLCAN